MSKISAEDLSRQVKELLEYSLETKKRKFVETIELQFTLKNYDPSKDKRFTGSIALPNVPRPKLKVCLLATEKDAERAKEAGLDYKSEAEMKTWKKNKKIVKKFARSYNAFLCSSTIIRRIP